MSMYANQWTVEIGRPKKIDGKFTVLSREATARACSVLNKRALSLWLYFMFQQSGIEWDISPKAIENEGWIPRKSYYPARDELIKKGYMDKHAVYMFPKISTTQNEYTDIPNLRKSTTQNEYSNNTNNNNNNNYNNFVIINDDKVVERPNEIIEDFVF